MNRISLIALTLMMGSSHAEESIDNLMDLSIEELLDISVSVASERTEPLTGAPGTVSRYDAAELASFGVHRFIDMLRFIPGIIVAESLTGNAIVQIRGISDRENQKVLFVVNNSPYWMASSGNSPLWAIPVAAISHIEVIRGPASLKYGSNASAGVIKIVTKDDQKSQIKMTLGNNNLMHLTGYYSQKIGSELTLNSGFEKKQFDGYDASAVNAAIFNPGTGQFENTGVGTVTIGSENQSFYADLVHPDWKLTAQYYQSIEYGNNKNSLVEEGNVKRVGSLLAFEYYLKSDNVDWKFFADYNHFYRALNVEDVLAIVGQQGSTGGFFYDNDAEDNFRARLAAHANVHFNDELTLYTGIETEYRSSENLRLVDGNNGDDLRVISPAPLPPGQTDILIFPGGNIQESSVFAQLEKKMKSFRVLAGFRYVDNEATDAKAIPRLALVYQMSPEESVKLLHSQAYSSPTFRQSAVVDGFGNPVQYDIEAETLTTTELSYNYFKNNLLFVANAFHTSAEDLIVSPARSFINDTDVIRRTGVELDFQYQSKDKLYYINTSWLKEGADSQDGDLLARNYPEWFTSIGARRTYGDHQWGLTFEHFSELEYIGSGSRAALSWRYIKNQFQPFITINNLFDDHVETTDFNVESDFKLQTFQGRNVFVGFKMTFD